MARIDFLGVALATLSLVAAPACNGDDDGGVPSVIPDDYRSTYSEAYSCRNSTEHDLNNIRVWISPDGQDAYVNRSGSIPEGAVIVKEEYDTNDADCTGDVILSSVMQRLADGSSANTLDWYWQEVDDSGKVTIEDGAGCIGCHSSCDDHFLNTCTQSN